MGGGGAIRAAAKVAGIGVVNSGIRGGISGVPAPAEQSVINASRPVSAIISKANGGDVPAAAVQSPSWELDDWEFAGGVEEEMVVDSAEPVTRVVFGGAPPSFQEAKAATGELKDALQKVYLSPFAAGGGGGGSLGGNQLTDNFETKSCMTNGTKVPKNAIKAFSLLNGNPKIQAVVAAVASDPKVWKAVWESEAFEEFFSSPSQSAQSSEASESVTDANFQDAESEAGNPKTEPLDFFDNVKLTVVEMVTNVSSYFQKFFGFSSAENSSEAADENAESATIEKSLGASIMALAVMVMMVVVLNRA